MMSEVLNQLRKQAMNKMYEPRSVTLKQISDAVYIVLNSSTLRPRFLKAENEIKECQQEILRLHNTDKSILRAIEERMNQVDIKFSKMDAQAEKEREYTDQRIGEIRH